MTGRRPDAIVVGAGIVGAAVAWYLARDGLVVDVFESGFPGGGTTAGGMGHVVVMDDSPAQLALTRYSRGLLADVANDLPADCELDRCGTLWLAEDEAQLEAAREKQACYAANGVAAEMIDAQQLADAEPELRPGLAGALRVPDDDVVYPPALARWLLGRAQALGARVHIGQTVQRITGGHAADAAAVIVDGEPLVAAVVVNAAGAAAPALTPVLDIVPRRGHLVITDRYPGFCRHQLVELGYLKSAHTMDAASVAFNLQPRTTGQVLIGSSRELVGWEPGVNRDVLGRMLARAVEFTPHLRELRAIRTWTAFRPATRDKLPYIGPVPGAPGIWAAAGHEGLGITTALGTGGILADLIAGRAPAIDAAPFDPARTMPTEAG
jgi:D-hydroxyproline dehydrogenase subunit beta